MKKQLSPIGRFVFGALVTPRTNDFGKTHWSCGLLLSNENAESIWQNIERALTDKRAHDPKFPRTNEGVRMPYRPSRDRQEDGTYKENPDALVWVFNKNYERKNRLTGETIRNNAPTLYDSTGQIIEDLSEVGFGSMVKVVYDVYCYSATGNYGVKLDLVGVQIAELKEITNTLPPIEGGFVATEAPTAASDISQMLASA